MVKDSFLNDSITIEDLKDLISFMIEGIINADYSEYNNFVESLQFLHSEIHAYIYQKYMEELIETTEEIKNNFEKILEEMPAE